MAAKVSGGDEIVSSEDFFLAGVVTSPNYPNGYPNNLERTVTVHVERGKILRLEFTHFYVRCGDYVKITDGDGTTLMDNSCGQSLYPSVPSYFVSPVITTRSNTMEILFHTDDLTGSSKEGWSLSWIAVTPGEKALMSNSIGIFHPFQLSPSIMDIFIAS